MVGISAHRGRPSFLANTTHVLPTPFAYWPGAAGQGPRRRSEEGKASPHRTFPPAPERPGASARNDPAAIGASAGRAPGTARGGGRGNAEGGPRPTTTASPLQGGEGPRFTSFPVGACH